MSLRIIPNNQQESSVTTTKFGEAAEHAPGLQDILRTQEGPLNISSKLNNRHPLESRITTWEKTQEETKLEMYRRVFGAGEPIKRTMELNIVEATDFKPSVLGGSDSMHKDILLGKDTSVDWEDVYPGGFESGNNVKDFHTEMEKKMGI
ncbi:proteasome maturation factor [Spathaspora passalidarum NRRL Y-27907]|uniref:Proteasome maturation factor n=1 Tax=Spathaspora passalidarum (strain NRRL Y-27907 / 11-Y1) TaxID=619300 RepID=G3AEU0_SPAPN|nr:proteasome maturation factor [Spathaspora passalidarum NRRL Y-27907]EGW35770.1 proteasome maturation factor [Spathaspora passalidarum NRRL Y-27907]